MKSNSTSTQFDKKPETFIEFHEKLTYFLLIGVKYGTSTKENFDALLEIKKKMEISNMKEFIPRWEGLGQKKKLLAATEKYVFMYSYEFIITKLALMAGDLNNEKEQMKYYSVIKKIHEENTFCALEQVEEIADLCSKDEQVKSVFCLICDARFMSRKERMAQYYFNQMMFYKVRVDLKRALNEGKKAFDIYNEISYENIREVSNYCLTIIRLVDIELEIQFVESCKSKVSKVELFGGCLEYLIAGINLFPSSPLSIDTITFFLSFSDFFFYVEHYSKSKRIAKSLFFLMIEKFVNGKDKVPVMVWMNLFRAVSRVAYCYKEVGLFSSSLKWFLVAESYVNKHWPVLCNRLPAIELVTYYSRMGDVYYRKKDGEKAKEIWQKALRLVEGSFEESDIPKMAKSHMLTCQQLSEKIKNRKKFFKVNVDSKKEYNFEKFKKEITVDHLDLIKIGWMMNILEGNDFLKDKEKLNKIFAKMVEIDNILMVLKSFERELCCNFCERTGKKLMKCAKCKRVRYCSKRCQKKDWRIHKKSCTADY